MLRLTSQPWAKLPMPDEKPKAKRGRPRKQYLRTPAQLNDVILKVGNSTRMVSTPTGAQEMSFFELNVLNTGSDKASVRIGANSFVKLMNRAAVDQENRENRVERERRMEARGRADF